MHFGLIVREYNAPYPTAHGTAINTWSILRSLLTTGHKVTVFLISNNLTKRCEELIATGVDVKMLPYGKKNWNVTSSNFSLRRPREILFPELETFYPWVALAPAMKELLDEVKPDAVLAYTLADLSVTHGLDVCPRMAVLVDLEDLVVHYRWRATPLRPVRRFASMSLRRFAFARHTDFMKQLLAGCESVVDFAAHHAAWLTANGIANCLYIPPPTRDAVGPKWRELRGSYQARSKVRILLVGHLAGIATISGIELFIHKVLPIIEKKLALDSFEVHVVGDYSQNPELAARLRRPTVVLRGYVEDVSCEFLSSDVLLVPTPIDLGTRTRVIEGFSYGCCVVAHVANALGIPQMVHEENALLAADGSALAEALIRALNSPALREKLGGNARRTYEEEFSIERAGARITAELNRIAQTQSNQ